MSCRHEVRKRRAQWGGRGFSPHAGSFISEAVQSVEIKFDMGSTRIHCKNAIWVRISHVCL
jgi:hypothetical protein